MITKETEPVRIIVIMPQAAGYFSEVLKGIGAFSLQMRTWRCEFFPFYNHALKRMAQRKPHGVIVNADREHLYGDLIATGVPVVSVTERLGERITRVGVDDEDIGRLAASYLLERGMKHFGFCGYERAPYAIGRERGFRTEIEKAKCEMNTFMFNEHADDLDQEQRRMEQWFTTIRRPAAILAVNDGMGLQLLQIAEWLDIRIPEDIAILGVDNNDWQCQFAYPPLSSIDIAPQRVGYEAASLLRKLIDDKTTPTSPILFPPINVITRQSTDVLAIKDVHIAEAISFIRRQAHQPINVSDVLDHVPVARRTLEKQFHRVLGRSPLQEIYRVRVSMARNLLVRTDLSMAAIARKCGFYDASQLSNAFRKYAGQSPSTFRKKSRMNSE